jgi:hypothetical protein
MFALLYISEIILLSKLRAQSFPTQSKDQRATGLAEASFD